MLEKLIGYIWNGAIDIVLQGEVIQSDKYGNNDMSK